MASAVALLVLGLTVGANLFDRLGTVDGLSAGSESTRGEHRIQALVSDGPIVYAVLENVDGYDAALVADVSRVVAELGRTPGVVEVISTYAAPPGPIGADNRSSIVTVELAENLEERDQEALEDTVTAALRTIATPTVLIGGDHLARRAFGDQAGQDLAVGKSVSFALLIVALVLVLGGFLAALLPIAVAVVGVSATLLVRFGISTLTTVGEYSVNIVTLLGIGLAVDYSLLIVARFRQQRAAGDGVEPAIVTAMSYAGRAVAVSGLAVTLALAGLTAFAEPLLASMAVGGMVSVLLTTVLALTVVPAMLAILGERIPPAGRRSPRLSALLARLPVAGQPTTRQLVGLATFSQRRPDGDPVATVGLLVLALPLLGANFGNSDARALPASNAQRQAYDAYQELFNQQLPVPVTLVAEIDAGQSGPNEGSECRERTGSAGARTG